jgi:hypothetical protein
MNTYMTAFACGKDAPRIMSNPDVAWRLHMFPSFDPQAPCTLPAACPPILVANAILYNGHVKVETTKGQWEEFIHVTPYRQPETFDAGQSVKRAVFARRMFFAVVGLGLARECHDRADLLPAERTLMEEAKSVRESLWSDDTSRERIVNIRILQRLVNVLDTTNALSRREIRKLWWELETVADTHVAADWWRVS